MKLFLYDGGDDFKEFEEYQKEESYVISSKYSNYIGAELNATLLQKGIDLESFKNALENARIRFSVYRKVVPALMISNSVQARKAEIISKFESFGEGSGLVIPIQELVITNFEYNQNSSNELEALMGVDFLENIKAKLSINLIKTQSLDLYLPASSTIAIKPFPVYFKSKENYFWGRWRQ